MNGEATLGPLERCDLPGEFLTWGDILMEGPVVHGLSGADDWRIRAEYLHARFNIPGERYLQRMADCHAALERFARHDEVVLWFEEDWFCQIHLVYLLAWFAHRPLGPTRLSCVCPAEPLGSMERGRLRALFDERERVTAERTAIACQAWAAYGHPEPAALERLRAADLLAWPLLGRGLECHLRRFPSMDNGASVLENEILRALDGGPLPFTTLFRRVAAAPPIAPYGIGDAQLAAYLRELAPTLVTVSDPAEPFAGWRLEITEAGHEVRTGRRDLVALAGIDRWLGGVRLTGRESRWRWDGASETLVGRRA